MSSYYAHLSRSGLTLDNSSEGYSTLESGCSPDNPPFEVALLSDLKSSAHFIYLFFFNDWKSKNQLLFL